MAKVQLFIDFKPERVLPFLNTMAMHNADLLVEHPELPLLYDSGVIYAREEEERFSDVLETLKAGREDCDSLAPYRAGELVAKGWRALKPGDEGYDLAMELRPDTIQACCFISTSSDVDDPSPLFHVETEYWVGRRRYQDDPSERLGMNGDIDRTVELRWRRAGVRAGQRFMTGAGFVAAVPLSGRARR